MDKGAEKPRGYLVQLANLCPYALVLEAQCL